jgi:hypothetical protein
MFPFLVVALIVACSAETGAAPTATTAPAEVSASAADSTSNEGVLLIWHRSDESAGICEVLTASTGGALQAGPCNAEPTVARLNEDERLQLQTWAVRYGSIVLVVGDPAAEALFTTLEMNGLGSEQPSEAEQQQMLAWAQDMYMRAVTP